MSPWSADPLQIALIPGEAALLGGGESRLLTSDTRTASSLLPLLDEALADTVWPRRRVEVVLSQQFVRPVLTPPPGKALAAAEETALVAASLREIYGDEASGWRLAVHSQPPQAGLVGAAVDGELMQQLEALLARHGCRTVSIMPLASRAVRRLPARFDGWWLGVEPGWATLMGARGGIWQHLAAQPLDADWRTSLPEWVAREAECAAAPIARQVWLRPFGLGAVGNLTPAADGWQWHILPHDARAHSATALLYLNHKAQI
ncbi:MAG: hypothetical protein B7Y50_11275 [Hydrogenophilales bacterium 28-61-11]|nr:MAG: hypothetical protein B7Y50_11275 [Hydrogenophilales bacterium 28-61-11]OYZ56328.1 MAG: hypothetical protein B7Y21_11970 [Hydrogenophilales bacterium 16-61-112]OZA45735.1 MAG: hypothetical protein B7X81_07825 [Hydrogenophilales bacterium 17-61-76]HQT31218.1 hypothetical protein [Thiobacillus sp.]